MPIMIQYSGRMIRISPKNSENIEYSTNGGRTWIPLFLGHNAGTFFDLMDNGREILAQTSRGVFYSTNGGRTWIPRRLN